MFSVHQPGPGDHSRVSHLAGLDIKVRGGEPWNDGAGCACAGVHTLRTLVLMQAQNERRNGAVRKIWGTLWQRRGWYAHDHPGSQSS